MKNQKKKRWRKTAVRAAAGILTLGTAVSIFGLYNKIAYAKTTSNISKAQAQVIGDQNPSDELWSWYKIEDQEDFDNLWDTYASYNVEGWDKDTGTIPIMLVIDTVKDNVSTRAIIQPSGPNNGTRTSSSNCWDWVLTDGWYQRDSWYFQTAYDTTSIDGWGDPNLYSDGGIVTRGNGGCFFLEKLSDPPTLSGYKTAYTYPYRLHNYQLQDGTYIASDEVLVMEKMTKGMQFGSDNPWLAFSSNASTIASDFSSWKVDEYNNAGMFTFSRQIVYDQSGRGYLSNCSLKLSQNLNWQVHCGITDCQGGIFNSSWSGNKWYSNDKSGDREAFYIYYGVPGVSYSALNRVDGNSADESAQETDDTATSSSDAKMQGVSSLSNDLEVKSDSTLALNPRQVYYLKSSETLKVNAGGSLIIGRNCLMVANGNIVNDGEIIIQPGGMLITMDPQTSGGRITGSGNLVIRNGGKMKVTELSITGDVHNDGFLLINKILNPGASYTSQNGALFAGTSKGLDLINNSSSVLITYMSSVWGSLGGTSGRSISQYQNPSVTSGARLCYK